MKVGPKSSLRPFLHRALQFVPTLCSSLMKIAAKMNFLNFKYLPIHDKLVVDCGIDIQ